VEFNQCINVFSPNLQLGFGTAPPIPKISGPDCQQFYYWAGTIFETEEPKIIFGTVGRVRLDHLPPKKQDQWTLNSTGTPNLVRVKEVNKSEIEGGHHIYNLPNECPDWIKTLIY